MIQLANIPTGVYKALIILATLIWGFSFVVMKNVVEVIPPAWLLGIRFTTAGLILLLILLPRVRKCFSLKILGAGFLLALFDFSAFWTQTVGLQHTTPGINAFLTATYCVIVPFVWWVLAHHRPSLCNLGAAVIALGGIWLVSVSTSGETLTLGFGEAMTLLCAVLFAIHIALVSRCSRVHDVLVLTVFQFIGEGLLGLGVGALTEVPPALSAITPDIVGSMAFLIVFASIVAFGIQNVALAHVPPAQTALFLSLEAVFGVVFSILLYGEVLTLRLGMGFALIFVAILVDELLAPWLEAKRAIVAQKRKRWKEDEPHV